MLLHRGAKPFEASPAGIGLLIAGDVADATVSKTDEVIDCDLRSSRIVDYNKRIGRGDRTTIDEHHRDRKSSEGFHEGIV